MESFVRSLELMDGCSNGAQKCTRSLKQPSLVGRKEEGRNRKREGKEEPLTKLPELSGALFQRTCVLSFVAPKKC